MSSSALNLNFAANQQILFQVDQRDATKLDVFDNGRLVSQSSIASTDLVQVRVAGNDAVTVDYSHGLPFANGIQIQLSGSGSQNSLTLEGSVQGGETYISQRNTIIGEAASMTVGGNATIFNNDGEFLFTSAIGTVTDQLQTTAPLVVESFGANVTLSDQVHVLPLAGAAAALPGTIIVQQKLSGLSDGGAGDTLTFSNKQSVNLEMLSDNATATLNAALAPAGEQTFQVTLQGNSELVAINATPHTVTTSVTTNSPFGTAKFATVNLFGNSGQVNITGDPATTNVTLGKGSGSTFVTSNIGLGVSVQNVKTLSVADFNNTTTQENVTVTEKTIQFGSSFFGPQVKYSGVGSLAFFTGDLLKGLPEKYTIQGSSSTARFVTPINIVDDAAVGLTVDVHLTAFSELNLNVQNGEGESVGPATIVVDAPAAKSFKLQQTAAGGTDTVFFGVGIPTSTVQFEADPGPVHVHNTTI
jgi:hypothetical protein